MGKFNSMEPWTNKKFWDSRFMIRSMNGATETAPDTTYIKNIEQPIQMPETPGINRYVSSFRPLDRNKEGYLTRYNSIQPYCSHNLPYVNR